MPTLDPYGDELIRSMLVDNPRRGLAMPLVDL
jgi:hypothetical protein